MSEQVAIFKCAFGGHDGWGHVTRSGALASVFSREGWRTILWSDSDASTLPDETRDSFAEIESGLGPPLSAHLASILVIDEMYTPDAAFQALRTAWPGNTLFVGIDDMQRRSMAAFDLVINTEIGLRKARYASAQALLGERYALLRAGFASPLEVTDFVPPEGSVPVFIMLGGTDAYGYVPRVLESLLDIEERRFAPALVLGTQSKDRDHVSRLLARFPCSRLLESLDSRQIAGWMRRCSFGIIGCGSSLYELAAMGLPFIGLSLVDNQTATARKVESLWRMPVLYREECHKTPLDLSACVSSVLETFGSKFVAAPYSVIDCDGAKRIFKAIF